MNWISTDKQMPEYHDNVLFVVKEDLGRKRAKNKVCYGYRDRGFVWRNYLERDNQCNPVDVAEKDVVRWMSLPEAPK